METGYSVTAWCLVGAGQVCAGNGCVTGLRRGSTWVEGTIPGMSGCYHSHR